MNVYYSMLGRLMDGRTPIRSEGYYILDDQNEVIFSQKAPIQAEVVTLEHFTNALVEGCRHVIHSFAGTANNKEVYAFNLYADGHNSFYVYLNTMNGFEQTLESYQRDDDRYLEQDRIQSLKYNSGDFQFWQEHMGPHGQYVTLFETIAYRASDIDKEQAQQVTAGVPVAAFEAGIIENGYYVCALKAMQQLVAEDAFHSLNRTDDFIAFASTGNDYLDYGLVMRKTISQDLFYRVFPNIQKLDEEFHEEMSRYKSLTVADSIAYWSNAIHSDSNLEPPFTYIRSAMEVFVQLEHFGNELAKECLERLAEFSNLEQFGRNDYDRINFYIEALYFCGPLTPEQTKQCAMIGQNFNRSDEDLLEYARELASIAS